MIYLFSIAFCVEKYYFHDRNNDRYDNIEYGFVVWMYDSRKNDIGYATVQ